THSAGFVGATSFGYVIHSDSGDSNVATVTIRVDPAPVPPAPTCTLTATPSSINQGFSSTLLWTTTNNPTSSSIDNGIGSVNPAGGSINVSPATTTTYTLTVTNTAGTNQ